MSFRWIAPLVLATMLCGCDVFGDESLTTGTFEAKASGVVRARLDGKAHYVVYGSGEHRSVIFYFLPEGSELPGPLPVGYDPPGLFIRTRWAPGTEAAMRLPADQGLLFDRMLLPDGRRYLVTDGLFMITEADSGRAAGEFSLEAIEWPPTGNPWFQIAGAFDALQAPAL